MSPLQISLQKAASSKAHIGAERRGNHAPALCEGSQSIFRTNPAIGASVSSTDSALPLSTLFEGERGIDRPGCKRCRHDRCPLHWPGR